VPDVDVVIAPEPFDRPGPQSLVNAAKDELDALYGRDGRGASDLHDGDFDPPRGCYLVARSEGHLAGGVGLRPIVEPEARTGEVKRLWVRPDLRRFGVATALMAAVVAQARALGYATLYLETGPRQLAAHELYRRLAWTPVEGYPAGAHVHKEGLRFRLDLEALGR
jgi:GNAT superfamily N-acetyltransferase